MSDPEHEEWMRGQLQRKKRNAEHLKQILGLHALARDPKPALDEKPRLDASGDVLKEDTDDDEYYE